MLDETLNDPAIWKNDAPIVLVHGYCGTTMDENWILGGYFHYAFSKKARLIQKCDDIPLSNNNPNGPHAP
jgi:hypothetical protein